MKPIHAKTISKVYERLKSVKGKQVSEWISCGRYNGSCKENTGESKIRTYPY